MPQIRPVSDLRNNCAEISRIVHEANEPVFLTKNGYKMIKAQPVDMFPHTEHLETVCLLIKDN